MRFGNNFRPPRQILPDGSQTIHGFHPAYSHIDYFFCRWPATHPPLPINYFKFTFVRNPFDRFYSFYKSKIRNGQNPGKYYEKFGLTKDSTFDECVSTITSIEPNLLESHAAPQSMIICDDDKILVDFIGKIENFKNDWANICKLTGFNIALEHLNRTESHFSTGYTEKNKKLIIDYYRDDFDLLGYNFEKTDGCNQSGISESIESSHMNRAINDISAKKDKIHLSSTKFRDKASFFGLYPEKRKKFYEHQSENFREMLLKSYYVCDTKNNELKLRQEHFEKNQKQHLSENNNKINKNVSDIDTLKKNIDSLKKWNENLDKNTTKLSKDIQANANRIDIEHDILRNFIQCNILQQYKKARFGFVKRSKSFLLNTTNKEIKIILKSGLFDSFYYYKTYPGITSFGLSSIKHFVRYGVFEGKNPSGSFNTIDYLISNPDCLFSGANPLVHFIQKK